MKKRLLCILLALLMVMMFLPVGALADTYSGSCGENVTWSLDTDTGELIISGNGAMNDYERVYGVHSYPTAPWGVYYSLIKEVIINPGVTSIGDYAFHGCDMIESVTIPNSVTRIGWSAFFECRKLTSVTIPESVASIGNVAFSYCTSLISIDVSEDNNSFTSMDGVLFNKNKSNLITCPAGKSGSYIIPESVEGIGKYAFYGCSHITDVTIPDSVTSIGYGAFRSCYDITYVSIGNGLLSIDDEAFRYCGGLISITIPESITSIGRYAFDGCDLLSDVYYSGTLEQWNSIETFGGNDYLINATIHYHEHSYNSSITAPTCTDGGYTTYTCACGDNYIDNYTDALGHDIEVVGAKETTCTEAGYTGDKVCKTCGEIVAQGETVDALGHDYQNGVCQHCGQKESVNAFVSFFKHVIQTIKDFFGKLFP